MTNICNGVPSSDARFSHQLLDGNRKPFRPSQLVPYPEQPKINQLLLRIKFSGAQFDERAELLDKIHLFHNDIPPPARRSLVLQQLPFRVLLLAFEDFPRLLVHGWLFLRLFDRLSLGIVGVLVRRIEDVARVLREALHRAIC